MSPEHAENVSEARTRADNPVPQREAFLVKQFHNASSNPSKACVRQLRFRRQNREEEQWGVGSGHQIDSRSECPAPLAPFGERGWG